MDAQTVLRKLPQVDSRRVRAATRLAAALGAQGLEQLRQLPGDAPAPSAMQQWIEFETDHGQLRLMPLKSAGQPLQLGLTRDGSDLGAFVRNLSAVESLVVAIELALDTPLIPRAVRGGGLDDRIGLHVADPHGNAVLVGVPVDVAERVPMPRLARPPDVCAELPIPCQVTLGDCRLTTAQLAELSTGDVLLVAARSVQWPVQLRPTQAVDPRIAYSARFDPAHQLITFDRSEVAMMSDQPASHPTTQPGAPDWSSLPVRVRFELAALSVPLSTLTGLHPGAVVSVGDVTRSIPVSMMIEDRRIGEGELVAVGDGYGVRLLRMT